MLSAIMIMVVVITVLVFQLIVSFIAGDLDIREHNGKMNCYGNNIIFLWSTFRC